jgi:fructose-bisphosphate aldolase class II
MNIDTDLQFAFTEGIRDYMVKNIDYLHKLKQMVLIFQIKILRPRKWLRESEDYFQYKIGTSIC